MVGLTCRHVAGTVAAAEGDRIVVRDRGHRTYLSRSGWLGWGLALVCLSDLVEEGLGANGLLAVDGGEPLSGGVVGLGGLDDGAIGPDGRSDDQGEGEGVARAGVDLSDAVGAVHHDGRVVDASAEAVDADLAQVAAEGLDQACGEVGAEWPRELGAVAQEA